MGISTGTVVGQQIESNRGSANVRMLDVQLLGSVPEVVEFFNVSGEDTAPANGDKIIVFDVGGYKFSIGTKDLIVAAVQAGEKKLYSQESGAIKAYLYLLKSGILELNGNADFAVRFSDLETAFNQLKSDYNAHAHGGVDTGSGTSGGTNTPSTADIAPAKVDTVKLP
jgi:hypothetical protein